MIPSTRLRPSFARDCLDFFSRRGRSFPSSVLMMLSVSMVVFCCCQSSEWSVFVCVCALGWGTGTVTRSALCSGSERE